MDTSDRLEEAIEVLQQLGLKEYEARCFVGLSRLHTGTAKKLSEMTEVPRTRVYDAIHVLEAQGLVEIEHSSPQQFRAVPLDEATETLRDQYEDRVERVHDALDAIEVVDPDDETPVQEVWAMSGGDGIKNRTNQLIEQATDEVVLIIGDDSLLTLGLVETLNDVDDDVDLLIGALTEELEEDVQAAVPNATTFISGLEWLHGQAELEDETAIGRLLLADRSAILVSSIVPGAKEERAIFGEGSGTDSSSSRGDSWPRACSPRATPGSNRRLRSVRAVRVAVRERFDGEVLAALEAHPTAAIDERQPATGP